jgi:hypothetical protein
MDTKIHLQIGEEHENIEVMKLGDALARIENPGQFLARRNKETPGITRPKDLFKIERTANRDTVNWLEHVRNVTPQTSEFEHSEGQTLRSISIKVSTDMNMMGFHKNIQHCCGLDNSFLVKWSVFLAKRRLSKSPQGFRTILRMSPHLWPYVILKTMPNGTTVIEKPKLYKTR